MFQACCSVPGYNKPDLHIDSVNRLTEYPRKPWGSSVCYFNGRPCEHVSLRSYPSVCKVGVADLLPASVNYKDYHQLSSPLLSPLVSVLMVGLSYAARNVSCTRHMMQNFLAFRASHITPLRRLPQRSVNLIAPSGGAHISPSKVWPRVCAFSTRALKCSYHPDVSIWTTQQSNSL